MQTRIADSLETALSLADGRVLVDIIDGEELLFSQHHACPECGFSIPELEPRAFSFNSPYGACQSCDGLGVKLEVDSELVIPDASRSLNDGAVALGSLQAQRITHSCYKQSVNILALI